MSCPTQKEGWTQALPWSQGLQKCPRPQNSSRFCRHSHSHATNTQVPEVSRCPWTPQPLPPWVPRVALWCGSDGPWGLGCISSHCPGQALTPLGTEVPRPSVLEVL